MSKRKEQLADIKLSLSEGTVLDQFTFEDYRIYVDKEDGDVYASVTTVLEEIKPDKFLEMWKEKEGSHTVAQVLEKASKEGTSVHNAIEKLCIDYQNGEEPVVYLLNEYGNMAYNENEWKGIMRFVDFFKNHVEEVLMTEQRLKSKILKVAGTVDSIFRLKDGRKVLVDHKFSNSLSDKYSAQTWCYAKMYEEMYGENLDGRANLWLKASTRGPDKSGKKIQGEGWQLVFHEEDFRDETVFMAAHSLFFDRYRNKPLQPLDRIYPTKLSLI